MTNLQISVRELGGWPLDHYEHRPSSLDLSKHRAVQALVAQRPPHLASDPVIHSATQVIEPLLAPHRLRADLQAEMAGLDWSLGVVDLRLLLAFQRRLSFHPTQPVVPLPLQTDWHGLTSIAFALAKSPIFALGRQPTGFTLSSPDPNLHLRASENPLLPMLVHAGSPFFEVACLRGRWFLRDGYHRAFSLLQAGIVHLPAVVVHARTLEELGATQPWFFSEATLFSSTPPRVVDFLDDALTFKYQRPPLIKTLRVTIEETLEPASSGASS